MSRFASYLLAALVAVVIFQLVVLAPEGVNQPQSGAVTSPAVVPADVEQVMTGVHLVETQLGGREWELWADEAVAFKGRNLWRLKQVKVIFFADNGVEFTVTGAAGEIDSESKNLSISGQVLTRSSNGYVFKTEMVSYDSKGRKLLGPGDVVMVGPPDQNGGALSLKGTGLLADTKDAMMSIQKNVRAEKTFSGGRHAVIRSQGARFSGRSRMAKFMGTVVMDMDAMRITGPEAEFEYGPGNDMVKAIEVVGGVKVSDTEKWATADRLKVQFDKDRYVFRGNPRLVQDSDELRGEEIVFLDGGRKIQVLKARAKVDEKSLEKAN